MQDNIIYDDDGLIFIKRDSRFYLRYEVGSHQVGLREDEISKNEVDLIMKSPEDATKVLFSLQKRLEDSGVKTYKSNI